MVRAPHDASALRFLAFYLGLWVAVRALAYWNPAMPPPPAAPWDPAPAAFAEAPSGRAADRATAFASAAAPPRRAARHDDRKPAFAGGGLDRHSLRMALFMRSMTAWSPRARQLAVPLRDAPWLARTAPGEPGGGAPFWMQSDQRGWSASAWLFARNGGDEAPAAVAGPGRLGGGQAGVRLAYGFAPAGRLRAYGRATIALDHPGEREVAAGLAFAPSARWPVDVAIEQRMAAGPGGRTALAAMVSGGVSDVALPGGFRLDAYGQAGIVGVHRRDGFADGALVVDRRLGIARESPLRLGALAAGAVQPGASRVDVGPRLTLRLPDLGHGSRIALDWRQRVAGDALPESGIAVTLAADF